MKCVISVLGKDRSGVVAAIATTLADCGANIDDISQTILGEGRMFSMTMMVTLDPAVADFNTVQERLAADGERLSMQVLILRLAAKLSFSRQTRNRNNRPIFCLKNSRCV